MRSDDPRLYGDTFLQGVVHTQKKHDQELVKALHKAYGYGESKDFTLGLMIALRVLRGESYERRLTTSDKKLNQPT